ncbi:MAG: hypothetical protein WAP52_03280 [Candidatus Sungiibacteriota bacterium]
MLTKTRAPLHYGYPLMTGKERLSAWQKAQSVWGRHKWNAINELKKIRGEWERKLPFTP